MQLYKFFIKPNLFRAKSYHLIQIYDTLKAHFRKEKFTYEQ